ncbi:MAG: hypothetical protein WBF17_02975 [Phycisphaerae bacterium]
MRDASYSRLLPAMLTGLLAGAFCAADEVDGLVARLRPPERFKDHRPDWSVSKDEVTFEFMDGPQAWPFWFVKDGGRIVAVIPTVGFHTGTVYVQDFRPGRGPKKIKFPTERWHIDTAIGSELRTNNFIPGKEGATDATYDWKVAGETLTLVRRYKGTTKFNRWAHRTKDPVRVDAVNTVVFRVHPVLGYVVEATFDTWTDPPPKKYEYVSAATSGRYLLWPGEATCFRHAITPPGGDGYIGHACNHGATKKHGGAACRDGGFVSFLNDETGWSPTTTIVKGGDARLVICGAHTDLDFVMNWPTDPETRADGLKHNVVKHRLLALPPELTKHVWDNMKVLNEGESRLMIRFGVCEDFEAQPLPLTTRLRGMPWNAEVTEKFARSGRKSIVFSGNSGHGDPQIALRPNARYRVEAWVKVVDWTSEQRKAAEDALREKIERARQAAEKAKARGRKPGPVPEFAPPGKAEAYLSGWFYQWSPHSGQKLAECKSNVAKPSDNWQRLAFEFTTPKWGPFIQLAFHADNCAAYLDDFQFARMDAAK